MLEVDLIESMNQEGSILFIAWAYSEFVAIYMSKDVSELILLRSHGKASVTLFYLP